MGYRIIIRSGVRELCGLEFSRISSDAVRSRASQGDCLAAINACKQREPRATMRATMRVTAAIHRYGRSI